MGALNVLIRLSSDDRLNYALGEGGEDLVDALVQVFDDAIGWTGGNAEVYRGGGDAAAEDGGGGDLDPTPSTWDNALFHTPERSKGNEEGEKKEKESWAEFCARKLCQSSSTSYASSRITEAEYAMLHVIILVVRNLSYVAANGRFLVHNVGMMRILTGCLYFRAFEKSNEDDRGRAGGANNL